MNEVAAAGGSGKPAFAPRSISELRDSFRSITASLPACRFGLSGTILPGGECRGSVEINGARLACDQADGWRSTGPSSIELTGAACETYRQTQGSIVQASFPCDAVKL